MSRIKLVIVTILAVVGVFLVIYNFDPVPTYLVVTKTPISMPSALRMVIMAGIGFVIGMYVGNRRARRPAKK